MRTIRVLLVDDSAAFLDVAALFLSGLPDVEVAGCACSGARALAMLTGTPVDLVIVDLAMPGMDGLQTTRRIKQASCAPRVVVVTFHDGPEYEAAAAEAGADAFVSKPELAVGLLPVLDGIRREEER